MDALGPRLEVRVLGLQHLAVGEGVGPVAEPDLVVVVDRVGDRQPLVPREGQGLAVAGEVVLDVALGADVGPHLVVGGLGDVPVLDALALLVFLHPGQERRSGDGQGHRLRVMAVDARDRVRGPLGRVGVRRLVHRGPGCRRVAADGVQHLGHRGVAVQARAGLLERRLGALDEPLVVEHVGVSAGLVVLHGEGVALPHRDEAWVLLQLALGDQLVALGRDRVTRGDDALVDRRVLPALVLGREVLAPFGRIEALRGQLDDLEVGLGGLLLALRDVHQQREDAGRDEGAHHEEGGRQEPALHPGRARGAVPGTRTHVTITSCGRPRCGSGGSRSAGWSGATAARPR